MQKVLLFVNPFLEQRRNQRATIERVIALLRSKGLEVELQQTFSPRSAGDQAREAIAAGFDTIVVCGGDGTIFDVVQGVAGTEVPLGVIPLGTGNVLAQNLSLPRNPLAAANALFRSQPKRVPLAKLTCHRPGHRKPGSWYFACVAGLGTHAYLMSAAERWGKRFNGRASYYFAGVELLIRQKIEPFEVEFTTTDGQVFKRHAGEVIATRVPELNRWRPGGSLEQPTLRLAICGATTRLGLAKASFQAITRIASTNGHASVEYFDTVRIACRLIPDYDYQGSILVEADGEVLGASEAVMTVTDQTISLLWPQ
jgi:diacylglycerol kinase family enzyme